MSESFRHYQVIETFHMGEEELQKVLDEATRGFPEKQIDHVVGTKIILGWESMLNEKGRAEAYAQRISDRISNSLSESNNLAR